LVRYLIDSPMLPQLKRDADGGLTLTIQNESPGKNKEANWLPAPKGPFTMYMRLYWPKPEALEGRWTARRLWGRRGKREQLKPRPYIALEPWVSVLELWAERLPI
jgi:Protein of unknown function (DUF1214)